MTHSGMPEQNVARGGQMGQRIRALDWSTTPMGPIDTWPQHLRSAVGICLDSNFPIALYLGPAFTLIYNDAWIPVPGDKHPWALGRPAHEVWFEIWDIIEPNYKQVMSTGEAIFAKDALFFMRRHGYTEECYFDYTLSPIHGTDGAVDGIFNAAIETTYRVLDERRMRRLRELAEHIATARSAEAACALATESFGAAPEDVPFALLYLVQVDGRHAELAGVAGIAKDTPASPWEIDLGGVDAGPWPLAVVARTGAPQLVSDLPNRLGYLPGGAWPEPAEQALVLPIAAGPDGLAGFLVAGVSPRRALDDNYRSFFEHTASHIATAVANARAYQMERQRAEALAELDHAKTAFFSNVSHEFRTPLTLMLEPLENLLTQGPIAHPTEIHESLTMVYRNSLRLMRLVNALLDFSRLEAGRVRASYAPTDLATLTTGLVGCFHSACAQAGLQLRVDCPRLPEPVHVDTDMWEQIVLNLVSNAFKFTFAGAIEVQLHATGEQCELVVRDTGIGISEAELPRIFERFHRVEAAQARTFEGTGIGLALVQELVKLHGGAVRVQSVLGQGSTFIVTIPFGTAHLPADRIGVATQPAATRTGASPYVEEALQWLAASDDQATRRPGDQATEAPFYVSPGLPVALSGPRPQVLLADDNADMREYVRRLLASRYVVEAVSDGQAALEAARRRRPALVLTDVMMPRLDGFGLLRALRADPNLRTVPVVLLSARADEEARVEGLEAGADDYLIKPFSARELLARVTAHMELVRLREAVERAAGRKETLGLLASIVESSQDAIIGTDLAGRITTWNRGAEQTFGYQAAEALGRPIALLIPHDTADKEAHIIERISGGEITDPFETEWKRKDDQQISVSLSVSPIRDGTGQVIGASWIARDMTEHKRAEEALRQAEAKYRGIFENAGEGIFQTTPAGRIITANPTLARMLGYESPADLLAAITDVRTQLNVEPARRSELMRLLEEHGTVQQFEVEYYRKDRSRISVSINARAVRDDRGRVRYYEGMSQDITERKRTEEELRRHREHLEELVAERTAELAAAKAKAEEADRLKSAFLASMSHELRTPLNGILGYAQILLRERGLSPRQADGLTIMQQSGEHLLALINDILDLAKIEAGKLDLVPTDVHFPTFLDGIVGIIRARAEQKGLTFRYAPEPPLPLGIRVDETRLCQVLLNLLSNAVKFTKQGSVTLRVSSELSVLSSELPDGEKETQNSKLKTQNSTTIRFEVIDTGVGISQDDMPRLFRPFEQLGAARQRAAGTGLGLAISQQLVQRMGSAIQLDSQVGRGSTFWFDLRLPVVAAPMATHRLPDRVIVGYTGRRRAILVVDDSADNRSVLVDLLAPLGFAVAEAADGPTALRLAQAAPPDLIFMDLRLPGMTGMDVTQALRQIDVLKEVVIIATSASVSDSDRQQSLQAGCNAFVSKPIRVAQLFDLIATQLGLTWRNTEEELRAAEAVEIDDANLLTPPSQAELAVLFELAAIGDLLGLQARAAQLAQGDVGLRPFALRLARFASQFEVEQARALIARYR